MTTIVEAVPQQQSMAFPFISPAGVKTLEKAHNSIQCSLHQTVGEKS